MNPQEVSAYLTNLLRSEAEVIVSFLMGFFFACVLVFVLRRWLFKGRAYKQRLAKKDIEIAKKTADIAQRDARIVALEAQVANLERKQPEKVEPAITPTPERIAVQSSKQSDFLLDSDADLSRKQREQMESENRKLLEVKQAQEQTIGGLRKELADARAELAHWTKWFKLHDENSAGLAENEPISRE